MNKFFYLSLFSFIIFFLISRVLFPWSDEPDVTLKTLRFINFLGYFFYFDKKNLYDLFIASGNVYSNCGIITSVTSLWSYINFSSCVSPLSLIIINTLITFASVSPFFLLFYFFSNFEKSNKFFSTEYLNAIILSILYGGAIYYLGNFSLEKFSLILSFSIFLFLKNYLVILFILFLIFLADGGSFIIISVFISVFYSLSLLNSIMKFKYTFLLSIFLLVCIYLSKQYFISFILEFINLPVRYAYLLEGMTGTDSSNTFTQTMNKYPFYYRITYFILSLIYLSQLQIKVIFLYVFTGITALIAFNKILKIFIKDSKIFNDTNLYNTVFAAFITIAIFFILLPLNVIGKNFIFILPILFRFLLYFYSRINLLKFVTINNIILFYFLTLYTL